MVSPKQSRHARMLVISAGCVLACLCIPFIMQGQIRSDGVELLQETVDFGVMRTRTPVKPRTVKIRNATALPVKVTRMEVGCGCIAARLSTGDDIPANGESDVLISLDEKKALVGQHAYDVSIYTDSETSPFIAIPVTYTFQPDIEVPTGGMLIESKGPYGQGAARIVDLSGKLKIRRVQSSSARITWTSIETTGMSEQGSKFHCVDIIGATTPLQPKGPIDESITLALEGVEPNTVVIPVKGSVQGPVKVSPATVMIGTAIEFDRQIEFLATEGVKFKSLKSSTDAIRAEVVKDGNGESNRIRLHGKLPATSAGKLREASIRVEFSKPSGEIEIVRVVGAPIRS